MARQNLQPILLLIAAGLTLSTPSVLAQVKGSPYVAVDAGVSFLENTTAHATWFGLPVKPRFGFDPGYRMDVRVGYLVPGGALLTAGRQDFVCNFAFELEAGLSGNPFTTPASVDANYYQVPLLANGVVIFPVTERFSFSLGIGFGGAFTTIRIEDVDGPVDFGFAYQGFGRLSYSLTPHLSVEAFGKAVGAPKTTFPTEGFPSFLEPLHMDGPLGVAGGLTITYLF